MTAEVNAASTAERIIEAYVGHVLKHGKDPASIYTFMEEVGLPEAEFYNHFGSFKGIEEKVWLHTLHKTQEILQADEVYHGYSIREKMLAFYFTWLEQLKAKRSFLLSTYQRGGHKLPTSSPVAALRSPFKQAMEALVLEGYEKGELQQRPLISEGYVEGLWMQMLFVLNFWMNDNTPRFERTDAAVEKAVNLAMDLMGRNTLDNAFDFVKFLLEKR